MLVYYNENDPKAAAWLRELIAAGLLPNGHVDERDIRDIRPSELLDYKQCHFFAGIGGWPHALELAGWGDRPVWTGSCPCQPFSAAGRGEGFADERHLWPSWHHLIEQCRPTVVFGEQVASKDALNWFDLVSADLAHAGYAVGAADLCAAGVGAPHIRQRLYWLADADGREPREAGAIQSSRKHRQQPQDGGAPFGLADAQSCIGAHRMGEHGSPKQHVSSRPWSGGGDGVRVNPARDGEVPPRNVGADGSVVRMGRPRADHTFWRDADWLGCRDGRWRPVEPGTQPLAHGLPGRVGLLRGYGNAIVPQVAQAFVEAYLEC